MFPLHENPCFGLLPKEKMLPLVDNFNRYLQAFVTDKTGHTSKGGRPKKKSSELKNKTIGICFSEPEYYAIKGRAERTGLPIGLYCHYAVLNGKIIEPVKKEQVELLKQLSGMGNNINQLVKLAHTFGLKTVENQAGVALDELRKFINQVSDDWKNHKGKKL